MKNSIIWSFLVLIILFVSGFFFLRNSPQNTSPIILKNNIEAVSVKYVKIDNVNVKIELALTPEEQNKGLSGRTSLDPQTGLLFIFKIPGKYSFWMKDMNFPIDIIWISEDLKIVYIKRNATPASYPDAYQPGEKDENAKYVLEVVSGFSDKHNLKVGYLVEFLYSY